MNTRLTLIIVNFIYLFEVLNAQNCTWSSEDGKTYDYSSLYKEEGYAVADSAPAEGAIFGVDILFNFCKPLEVSCDFNKTKVRAGAYEALNVLGQRTDTCEILGKFDSFEISELTADQDHGLNIIYTGGDLCFGSENENQNTFPQKITFKILCGAAGPWEQTKTNSLTVTKCSREFTIYHPAGCYHPSVWSFFSMMPFRWVMLLGFFYLIAGITYNRKVRNLRGIEAVPNIEFWRSTPTLVKNSLERVKIALSPNPKRYSRVPDTIQSYDFI